MLHARYRLLATLCVLTILLIAPQTTPAADPPGGVSNDGLWLDLGPGLPAAGALGGPDDESRLFRLDHGSLESVIARAPMEGTAVPVGGEVLLTIPMPDGTYLTFMIEESPIMEPELAASLPGVLTFRGTAIEDPTIRTRFDRTPLGFNAIILTSRGTAFVRPAVLGATEQYESYWLSRYRGVAFQCGVIDADFVSGESLMLALPTGDTLRRYRLAVAATGEYTQFFGSVAAALAGIATTVNQMNAIYEAEAAVRMILVADNVDIVYPDPDTDPFPLDDMNAEVQAAIDSVIGDANYDIGHLFHRGGTSISGNAGSIGNVCVSGAKGSAWSMGPDPNGGDFLFVVAHEMGHQYGGTHTFNGSNCSAGQYTASSSWEPGSGTTIMSYSSICGSDNVMGGQVGDLYFHVGSRDQITAYTQVGGGTCATTVNTGNNPPTVSAGPNWTIPQGTPFRLTATGNDPDGDPLTFTWEQFDQTAASAPLNAPDDGLIPLFRSFPPASDPVRTFPDYEDLLAGPGSLFPNKLGEQLPSTNRDLTFRTTARDNRLGGGGANDDQMIVTVSGDPFAVTFPNGGETVGAGAPLDVTWTVGGGSIAPTVNILYSTNGGVNWSTLAAGVANNGARTVTVPCGATNQGRIMIEAVGNIFFDISDLPFTTAAVAPAIVVNATGGSVDDACEFLVTFDATVTDDGAVTAADVDVTVTLLTGNAILGSPTVNIQQVNTTTVAVDGSVLVSGLTGSPATVRVTVEATDNCGVGATELAQADVADTTPPVVTCPADIVVECSAPGGVPADDPQLAGFFAAFTAVDNCDPDPEIVNDAPAFFAGPCDVSGGVTVVTWTATDASGNAAQCSATVTVVDTTPPDIEVSVMPQVLWPPNHRMVPVEFTVTVSDICDPDPEWILISVVSSEPDNDIGDGNTDGDIQEAEIGTPDTTMLLRAERSGTGIGRIYTATYEATDCSGNSAEASANVYVPHSPNRLGLIMAGDGANVTGDQVAYMISGASLWGRVIPAQFDEDQLLTISPRSAVISNTAGWVPTVSFFLADVDGDQIPDVLLSFDRSAIDDLVQASGEEDGDPVMVLDMGSGTFRILEMDDIQSGDLDLDAIIAQLGESDGRDELALDQGGDLSGDRGDGDAVVSDRTVARAAGLIGAAPNPFNPSTTISFYVPDSRNVELAIFDVSGRLVNRLLSRTVPAGEHAVQWHGTDTTGSPVSTGVYFYRLTAGSLVETKRMTLVK
jgi:hypothetical protein